MFQACVSISELYFMFLLIAYTGYVCINGHTAGLKKINQKNVPTYLPYLSVARYANTIFKKCFELTVVITSAAAIMSARPASMMCLSRSLSIGLIPSGTRSINCSIRFSSERRRESI